jgi:hypothetical protein
VNNLRSLPLLLPLLLAATAGCGTVSGRSGVTVEGSGTPASETRTPSGFHSVAYALPGELTITLGDAEGMRIEADDNLLPHIETRVRNGVLEIGSGRDQLRPRGPLRVHLDARALRRVVAAGSGSVEAHALRADELALAVAGSGSLRAHDLQASVLQVDVAGSGNVELSGRAPRQVLKIAGSGQLDALEVQSESIEASIAGSGSARVHASERINANLVGSGSVSYRGDPEVSTRRVGSGNVTRLDP